MGEWGIELRFSSSEVVVDKGAGVAVGVGEPSDLATGGGLAVPMLLALTAPEAGDSLSVPLVAASVTLVFTFGSCSVPVGESLLLGTSKLFLVMFRRSGGLATLTGNRPASDGPLERSRRCFRGGAGLLARLRSTIARFRASIAARRLLSSVLMARGRLDVDPSPRALD